MRPTISESSWRAAGDGGSLPPKHRAAALHELERSPRIAGSEAELLDSLLLRGYSVAQ
jgi:hypothetical protein